MGDIGSNFGRDIYEEEVRYIVENEWERREEEILWRRKKIGMRMKEEEVEEVKGFVENEIEE